MAAQIQIGASLPDTQLKIENPHKFISLDKLEGTNIIVGIPGAFTPPCSSQVPGYIEKYEELAAKGVKGVYVVAVNDVFVASAWKAKLAPNGTPVHFVADDEGKFSKSIGHTFDATELLGGHRALRYVLIVKDGKVAHVALEKSPLDVDLTTVDSTLSNL